MTRSRGVADAPAGRDDLGGRVARGAVVTLSGQAVQVMLQTAALVVLARLLTPRDYGLYATVLVIVGVGEIFRDFGLSAAAVQTPTLSRQQRDNLFWLNSALGCVLAVAAFVAAPLVAAVFRQPDLVGMTRVLSLTFVVNGVATQYRAGLVRHLRFPRLTAADLLGMAVGLTVGVFLAAAGARYWALVFSQLAQTTAVLLLLVLGGRWRPGRPRRGAGTRPLVRYGRDVVATQVVNYAGNNLDTATIAYRLGAVPLGGYNRAFQLVMNPLNQVRTPATTVALPVLSRLSTDIPRSNDYLRRSQLAMGYTVVAGISVAVGSAGPIVGLVLGAQWAQVAPLLSLLACAAMFQMLAFVGYWAYLSRGLTSDLLRYTVVSFALRAVGVLVGSQWGAVGVAAGYAAAHAAEWPLSLYWLSRRTVVPLRQLYLGATRVLGMAGCGAAVSYAVSASSTGWPDLVRIAAAAAAVALTYLGVAAAVPVVRSDLGSVTLLIRRLRRAEAPVPGRAYSSMRTPTAAPAMPAPRP